MKYINQLSFVAPFLLILFLLTACSESSFLTSRRYNLNRVAIDHSVVKADIHTNTVSTDNSSVVNTPIVNTDEVKTNTFTADEKPSVSPVAAIKLVKNVKEKIRENITHASNTATTSAISKPLKGNQIEKSSIRNSLKDLLVLDTLTLVLLILLCLLVFSILGFMGLINELIGVALLVLLIVLILYILKLI